MNTRIIAPTVSRMVWFHPGAENVQLAPDGEVYVRKPKSQQP